jgi:hypothetical protein
MWAVCEVHWKGCVFYYHDGMIRGKTAVLVLYEVIQYGQCNSHWEPHGEATRGGGGGGRRRASVRILTFSVRPSSVVRLSPVDLTWVVVAKGRKQSIVGTTVWVIWRPCVMWVKVVFLWQCMDGLGLVVQFTLGRLREWYTELQYPIQQYLHAFCCSFVWKDGTGGMERKCWGSIRMIGVLWGALLEDLEQRSIKTMREVCLLGRFYPLIVLPAFWARSVYPMGLRTVHSCNYTLMILQ